MFTMVASKNSVLIVLSKLLIVKIIRWLLYQTIATQFDLTIGH